MNLMVALLVALCFGVATFAWEVKAGFAKGRATAQALQTDMQRLLLELQEISRHTSHLEPETDD